MSDEDRDDPRTDIANFGAPKKATSKADHLGNWSHDGYPLVWPRCATCKKFDRPLTYVYEIGWICNDCEGKL